MSNTIKVDECPLEVFFGLTRSSYLVLPRVYLQAMPNEWQEKFVALLQEFEAAAKTAGINIPDKYHVNHLDPKGRFVKVEVPDYRHNRNLFNLRNK